MVAVTGYTVLKTFHVLFAVIWVGGAVTINILGTRATRSTDGSRIATFAGEAGWIGQRIYAPSAMLVLIFGILGVLNGHIGFAHAWVIIGLVGIGLTILTGAAFLGPSARRASEIVAARGPDDPEAKRLIGRLLVTGRIDLLVLFTVIAVMVIKPGA
jgi:uncharacterized membrane protein